MLTGITAKSGVTQGKGVIFTTDVLVAPHHLQHLPERDPKEINSTLQFRPTYTHRHTNPREISSKALGQPVARACWEM